MRLRELRELISKIPTTYDDRFIDVILDNDFSEHDHITLESGVSMGYDVTLKDVVGIYTDGEPENILDFYGVDSLEELDECEILRYKELYNDDGTQTHISFTITTWLDRLDD